MELCFISPCRLLFSLSPLILPRFPSPRAVFLYRNEPSAAAAAFYSMYASQQVCIGWRKTGACYTDKLTFSHGSSIKVWGAYYTNVCIIFEFLWYNAMSTNIALKITMVVPGIFVQTFRPKQN